VPVAASVVSAGAARALRAWPCTWLAWLAWLVMLASSVPTQAHAQAGFTSSEALALQVKAAFLFKFGEFVEWPDAAFAGPDAPFTLAVVGADALADVLEELARQRRINGRPVQVRRVRPAEPVPVAHIVFAGAAAVDRLHATAERLRAGHALTITDTAGAAPGMIHFVIRDNRVRFEIDAAAADDAGLKISSKVLSLALSVSGKPAGGAR
jgi:hypothetical protein